MPRSIPYNELWKDRRTVLRDVREGETLTITDQGEVVAVLVPPPMTTRASALRTRMAAGRRGCSGTAAGSTERPAD